MKSEYLKWFEKRVEQRPPEPLSPEQSAAFTHSVMEQVKAAAQEKHQKKVIPFPVPARMVAVAAAVAVICSLVWLGLQEEARPVSRVAEVESPAEALLETATVETLLAVFEQLDEPALDDDVDSFEQLEELLRTLDEADSYS